MTKERLKEILEQHKLWLGDGTKGERADLSYLDLSVFDLSEVVLSEAFLRSADLRFADLRSADLRFAYLQGADLSGADLRYANLYGADLSGADLRGADLRGADLSGVVLTDANLSEANLKGVNLNWADLHGANLRDTYLNKKEQIRKGIILQKEMIGWKKCRYNILVKLEIPKGAVVFSINNEKCRTNIAKVIKIIGGDGNYAISQHDEKFIYRLDEVVEVKDFNCQYNVECGAGIHFFRTKEEAENY